MDRAIIAAGIITIIGVMTLLQLKVDNCKGYCLEEQVVLCDENKEARDTQEDGEKERQEQVSICETAPN